MNSSTRLFRRYCKLSNYTKTKILNTRSIASDSAAYDGDGKTTVRVVGYEEPNVNYVSSYSEKGFRLSNNIFIFGSILLFPTHVYSWAVRRGKDITPESLIAFDIIVPKVKIVVIGYGQKGEPYNPQLINHLRKRNISCEVLPTPHAVTTYNYLVNDSVHVAGAFVPVLEEVVGRQSDIDNLFGHDHLRKDLPYFPDPDYQRETLENMSSRFKDLRRDDGKQKFD